MQKKNLALVIEEYETLDNVRIATRKEVSYSGDVQPYKNTFDKLVAKGYIVGCGYEDNIWVLVNNKEDLGSATLYFKYEINSTINNMLKAYALIKLEAKPKECVKIARSVDRISDMLKVSNFLNPENMDMCREYIHDLIADIPHEAYNTSLDMVEFVTFCTELYNDGYYQMFVSIPKPKHKSRELPPFKDIVRFDEIVQNFFHSNSHMELQEKYYPIYLWWVVTNVIPTRTGEFIRLRIDCMFEENGKYYINMPRIKRQKTDEEVRIQKIPITKDIYTLLSDYAKVVNIDNEKFLFNENRHKLYVPRKATSNRYTRESIGVSKFSLHLLNFYRDVVKGAYGDDYATKDQETSHSNVMICVQGNDTRHLSIINMMLQGYNPLMIAEMAGHESVYSQCAYIGHIQKFASVNSIKLSESIIFNWNNALESMGLIDDATSDIALNNAKAELAVRKGDYRKIAEGICIAKEVPDECEDVDCIFCNKCIPVIKKENVSLVEEIISTYRKKAIFKIDLQIDLIKDSFVRLSQGSTKIEEGMSFTANPKDVNETQTYFAQLSTLNAKVNKLKALELSLHRFRMEDM